MKTERAVELIFKLLDLEEDDALHTPVREHLEKECPEESKFIEELPDDQNDKIWTIIAGTIDKAFEIGFDKGFCVGFNKGSGH